MNNIIGVVENLLNDLEMLRIVKMILYVIIFIIGISGNILVCLVVY